TRRESGDRAIADRRSLLESSGPQRAPSRVSSPPRRSQPMLARVHSAATHGIDARVLDVEVDLSPGLPSFTIVGLPDASVREARERVRSPIRNSGFPLMEGAVTVNLAPADFRKVGASLDLPVAVALLGLPGGGPPDAVRRVFVGELGLAGEVRPIRGALCLALAARDAAFEE